MKSRDADAELEVDVVDSDGEGGTVTKKRQQWWQSFVDKQGIPKVKAVEQGPKIVLFLHILMGSITLGDKVVVFSQCLKTLDFIEEVLSLENWVDHVPSLASAFPGRHFGGWTRGLEYLRLDGATDSETRGQFIKKFQAKDEAPEDRVQLFLISCKAGGIGEFNTFLCARPTFVLDLS